MIKNFTKIITLLAIIMLIAGCSDSSKIVPVNPDSNNQQTEDEIHEDEDAAEDENTEDIPNEDSNTENPEDLIDLSLKPNELGEIMILMYHGIGEEESDWQRTPDNFRKDLEYMYQSGYRMISLNAYARGEITTEEGYTPIILTFDDGRQNNFDIAEVNGGYVINPDCAVGILEEFKQKYPDFNVTASFFLNSDAFGQEEYAGYKLKWLIENGYDIGNHTYSHNELELLTGSEIQAEIGSVNKIIYEYITDYTVETLALPHGSNPKDEYLSSVLRGEYDGISYENIAVLDVGWRPDYSPFDTLTDFTSLYRVTASEINVDNCGFYDYFRQFEESKRERFISDGYSDIVTIPKRHEEYLNMDMVKDKSVYIYE